MRPHKEPETLEVALALEEHKQNLKVIRKKLAEIDEELSKIENAKKRNPKGTPSSQSSGSQNDIIDEGEDESILNMSFEEFLDSCGLDRERYIQALRVSVKREVILFKRDVKDRRMNNFNRHLLETNSANMDIQPVLNPYAAVMYLTAYILKGEEGLSVLLKGVCQASAVGGETIGDKIRKLGRSFLNASEVSAQQAAFLLVGLPLNRCSLLSKYIPCTPRESRTGILKKKAALSAQPENSTDIMEKSMIDYFLIYHAQRKEETDLCLADFCCEYQMVSPKGMSKKHKEYSATLLGRDEDNDGDDGDEKYSEGGCLYLVMPKPAWAKDDVETQLRVFRKRLRTCIMRCPPVKKGSAEYYRQRLMLFLPGSLWCQRAEEEDDAGISSEDMALMVGTETFCDAYEANLDHILPMQRKYVFDEGIDYEDMERCVLQEIADDREKINASNREGQLEEKVEGSLNGIREKPSKGDGNDNVLAHLHITFHYKI